MTRSDAARWGSMLSEADGVEVGLGGERGI